MCGLRMSFPDLDAAAIEQAAPYFTRYGDAFILQLKANVGYLEEDFAQIQRIDYKRPFEECLTLAEIIIDAAMGR
jgi:hypothetical protein